MRGTLDILKSVTRDRLFEDFALVGLKIISKDTGSVFARNKSMRENQKKIKTRKKHC